MNTSKMDDGWLVDTTIGLASIKSAHGARHLLPPLTLPALLPALAIRPPSRLVRFWVGGEGGAL